MKNVLRLLCALSLALTLTACGQPPAAPDVSSPAGDPVSSAEAGALPISPIAIQVIGRCP